MFHFTLPVLNHFNASAAYRWSTEHSYKLASAAGRWFTQHWHDFGEWLSAPPVSWTLIAWVVTFTLLVIVGLSLGFGGTGVIAGSAAAAFQAFAYGGFTPAGGLFATLTSLAMLGYLVPVVTFIAGLGATIVAVIVWKCQ